MDQDILQSILDELSHLVIHPSQLTLEDAVELGSGGFSEVFLAVLRSSDSQTKVAVKQLRIAQAQSARRRVAIRLARELKVWASARHPNILKLVGFYLSDNYGCAQFVSAYMANGNVKEYINRQRPNLATRLRFVQGMTSGMSYLHNCNPPICHGDLKPANVLVNENPDAVLCDFGLATFIEESEVSSGLTTSKSLKGSTRYMAPELLEGEAKHTLESDVWAWACTIFEVLTDYVPFHDIKRDVAVLTALVQGQHPGSVDLLDSLVSGGHITSNPTLLDLKAIIPDCWIIDSAKRPSSSHILNRLILPDRFEALDIAAVSARIPGTFAKDGLPSQPQPPRSHVYMAPRQLRHSHPHLHPQQLISIPSASPSPNLSTSASGMPHPVQMAGFGLQNNGNFANAPYSPQMNAQLQAQHDMLLQRQRQATATPPSQGFYQSPRSPLAPLGHGRPQTVGVHPAPLAGNLGQTSRQSSAQLSASPRSPLADQSPYTNRLQMSPPNPNSFAVQKTQAERNQLLDLFRARSPPKTLVNIPNTAAPSLASVPGLVSVNPVPAPNLGTSSMSNSIFEGGFIPANVQFRAMTNRASRPGTFPTSPSK